MIQALSDPVVSGLSQPTMDSRIPSFYYPCTSLFMLPTEARLIISNLRLYQVITPFSAPGNFYPAGTSSQSKCHKRASECANDLLTLSGIMGVHSTLSRRVVHETVLQLIQTTSFSKGCASPHKPASLHSSMVLQSLASHPVHLSHRAEFLRKAEAFHRAGLSTSHSFSAELGFSTEIGFPEDLGSTQLVFILPTVTQLPPTKSLLKLLKGFRLINTSQERRVSSSGLRLLGISALSLKTEKNFSALFQTHTGLRDSSVQQHSRCRIQSRVIPVDSIYGTAGDTAPHSFLGVSHTCPFSCWASVALHMIQHGGAHSHWRQLGGHG